MDMSQRQDSARENWETYYLEKGKSNRAQWPNEAMLRVVFGKYLERPIQVDPGTKVLDVGCGTGNNLLPFLDRGCECSGIEVTDDIARKTQDLLESRGYQSLIKEGSNTQLPFSNDSFDIVLSLNVLHYEKNEDSIKTALREYSRVLKPDGVLFLMTVGQEHDIYKRATLVGGHQFLIKDWDFRDGEQFFFFTNHTHLKFYLEQFWQTIELGRTTEELMTMTTDFLIAVCRSKQD